MKDVPASGIQYVAQKLDVECETRVVYAHATLYRHQAEILECLGVTALGDQARELAISTVKHRNTLGCGWKAFAEHPKPNALEAAGIQVDTVSEGPGARTGDVVVKFL